MLCCACLCRRRRRCRGEYWHWRMVVNRHSRSCCATWITYSTIPLITALHGGFAFLPPYVPTLLHFALLLYLHTRRDVMPFPGDNLPLNAPRATYCSISLKQCFFLCWRTTSSPAFYLSWPSSSSSATTTITTTTIYFRWYFFSYYLPVDHFCDDSDDDLYILEPSYWCVVHLNHLFIQPSSPL